jgi:hypothetical protein
MVLLPNFGRIARPPAQKALKEGPEHESRDYIARPVGQHHYARQREPDR